MALDCCFIVNSTCGWGNEHRYWSSGASGLLMFLCVLRKVIFPFLSLSFWGQWVDFRRHVPVRCPAASRHPITGTYEYNCTSCYCQYATLICYFNCYLYIFFLGAHMTKLVRALCQVRIHRHWKRKVPVPSRTLWQWFCGLAIRALSWVLSQDRGHWWKQKGDGRLDSWKSKLPWGSITLDHLFLFNMYSWPFQW